MARFLAALFVLALLCVLPACGGGDSEGTGSTPEGPAWNHNPADISLGPAAWGEIDASFEQCLAGNSQSPVDIAATVPADLPELEFSYPETPLVVENTGHVIEFSLPEGSRHTLTIGDEVYRLLQFHFHAPSEHTLGGKSYDAEVHLVHESEEGELAVVAVFVESGHEPEFVDVLLDLAPGDAGEKVELDGEWSPLLLLLVADSTTAYGEGYYTYRGSLTTPGCTEGVRWLVDANVYPASPAAIARLHELIADFPGYDGYDSNNRPTQPLKDRVIQRDGL